VNLAIVAIISGEFEEMYYEAVAAATIAAWHSEPVLELLAQGMLAWAAAMAGRLDQALRARERSAAAFRSLSDDQLGEKLSGGRRCHRARRSPGLGGDKYRGPRPRR
jgi:hypothetical protein